MDPVLKSLLTSLLKDGLTGLGGFLVAHGYLSADGQTEFVSMATGAALVGASQLVSYWKSRQVTQTAMIQSVNAQPNGVKVVPADAPVARVDVPQNEEKK